MNEPSKYCSRPDVTEYAVAGGKVVVYDPARGMPEPDPRDASREAAAARKQQPVYSGVMAYFPDALLAVAHCSWVGNEQHNPGEPVHWARGKSMDQEDALVRHLLSAGALDTDGVRHSAKVAWRALAMLQLEIERERGK